MDMLYQEAANTSSRKKNRRRKRKPKKEPGPMRHHGEPHGLHTGPHGPPPRRSISKAFGHGQPSYVLKAALYYRDGNVALRAGAKKHNQTIKISSYQRTYKN